MDDHCHGTHVAGTIGGVGNNGIGVAGVNWNVQLMAVKFLDAGGSGTLENAVLAMHYAIANDVPISNNSWGGGGFSQALYDAIAAAGAQGHLFVAAAGNTGVNDDFDPMYPAAYDLENIVSVAATDHNDALAAFSNYGATTVDLGAPGVDIYSTMPGGQYGYLSGTSMATPHVAGVAALVRGLHPTWGYQEIKDTLLSTVDPIAALDGITVTGRPPECCCRRNRYAAARHDRPASERHHPSGVVATAVSTLRVAFNEAVTNFDSTDIASFTGPGGSIAIISVLPVDGSNGRQYDVAFASQAAEGAYTMVIGPGDLQDSSGNEMDQNRDGNQGQADDIYTAGFTIDYNPGPDGFGYEASIVSLENVNLELGAAGVFAILDGVDDSYAAVDLGTNTFAFYGTVYSGASLFVNSNGLITFGGGDASYSNGDLSGYPIQSGHRRTVGRLGDLQRRRRHGARQVRGRERQRHDGPAHHRMEQHLALRRFRVRRHVPGHSDPELVHARRPVRAELPRHRHQRRRSGGPQRHRWHQGRGFAGRQPPPDLGERRQPVFRHGRRPAIQRRAGRARPLH